MTEAAVVARRMWTMFEPIHALTYFAPEARQAFEQAGLRGFWRGYFAGRSAPLGRIAAAPVVASFYNFAPAMVARALPAVWDLISPAEALAVRTAGAVAALHRVIGGQPDLADTIPAAADRLARMLPRLDCAGRVLAAANAALPVPDEPAARLWHAATVLREHRGDGHFAALLAADVDGCEALVLRSGELPREQMQPLRGWSDAQWEQATARLDARGLAGPDGSETPDGVVLRAAVERSTDQAAARPWAATEPDELGRLAAVLAPIATACADELPFPNPVGIPVPAWASTSSGGSSARRGSP